VKNGQHEQESFTSKVKNGRWLITTLTGGNPQGYKEWTVQATMADHNDAWT
jgi:hypothetical protein